MMKREIIIKWIDKALEQDLHSKLYIPAESKEDAVKLRTEFRRELEVLYATDPENASTMVVGTIFKDSRHWVVLSRVLGNTLVGFVRHKDGTMERVRLSYDYERERRIELMFQDGMTVEQVEEAEGPLTEEEKQLYS